MKEYSILPALTDATILTFTGRMFDILEPTEDMIDIEDIAHASAQMNRFTGHCKYPYPVAQHSRLTSRIVEPGFELWALLHDAPEAYIGDMSRPLKHFTRAGEEYRKVEDRIMKVICRKYGLSLPEPREVKVADTIMLLHEKKQLMPPSDSWYTRKNKLMSRMTQKEFDAACKAAETGRGVEIMETSFRDNKRMFLERFHELYKAA